MTNGGTEETGAQKSDGCHQAAMASISGCRSTSRLVQARHHLGVTSPYRVMLNGQTLVCPFHRLRIQPACKRQ